MWGADLFSLPCSYIWLTWLTWILSQKSEMWRRRESHGVGYFVDGRVWIPELEALLYNRHVSRQSLYPATVSNISVLNTILKSLQSPWEQLTVWLIPLICCCRHSCCCSCGHKTPDKSILGKEGFFWATLQWSSASLPGSHGGRGWDRCLRCFQSQEAKSNGCWCSDLCLLCYAICPSPSLSMRWYCQYPAWAFN